MTRAVNKYFVCS